MSCVPCIQYLQQKHQVVPSHEVNQEKEFTDENLSDEELSDEELSDEKSSTLKPLTLYLLLVGSLVFVFGIVVLASYVDTPPESLSYLKDDSEYSHYDYDSELSARVMGHGRQHWLKCSDFDYGCCEVIYTYKNYTQKVKISPYKVVKHDLNGSNCPSVSDMIELYNERLGDDSCMQSDTGCCQLEGEQVNTDGNCPTVRGMIYLYETNYSDPIYDYLLFLCIFGGFVCLGCSKK